MGQHEYEVGLSIAQPKDMEAIAFAFRAGEEKAVNNILALLSTNSKATKLIMKEYNLETNTN
jgi:hypothetical protein